MDTARNGTGPAPPAPPLRPWSDQKSCHSLSKPYIFRVLVRQIVFQIEALFKWSDQYSTPSATHGEEVDKKTRKLLCMSGNFHRNSGVDRLYVKRRWGEKVGGEV